ncbi:pilin N-terminal domain-containing protein [Anaerococcus prevotii]|uniref:LPXTG-motif cell wall anchor domain protein n=1 Tax=Anaerococcus prevotii ACS-065-V-Col13 TaxID=879305 RepID=F0GV36_9FIRM|nr:pilin N-terminal domain-containing protein [Anaerococcus prevotii]EGC82260.1 LPXTG-motif cell wall anchor domain protein [Anaerococcus prevotii ACS-065-V-Col13]
MKNKLFSIFTALSMVLGILVSPFTSAMADEGDNTTTENKKTSTITLHKILQDEKDLNAKKDGKYVFPGTKGLNDEKYKGEQITDIAGYFGANSEPIAGVFFAVKNSSGEYIDKDGNKLAIQDPKVDGFKNQANLLGGPTTKDGLELDVSKLEQKNTAYTIEEIVELSTYKGENGELLAGKKAVPVKITLPITNDEGVVEQAHVYPKNTEEIPEIDKNFAKKHGLEVIEDNKKNNDAGADYNNYTKEKATVTAELGKEVPYEVKTKVDAGSKYQTLNWKDTMSNGLTFKKDEGVTIEATTVIEEGKEGKPEKIALTEGTDYKLTKDDRGFTLSLTKDGLDKVNSKTHPETGEGVAVEFTLTYSATVNKNAIVDKPEKNDIKLEYSNNQKQEKEPTPVTPDKEKGELKVTKTWSDGTTKDVQVVYTLSNGTKSYAVMMDGNKTSGTVDLGDGITFEITGAYAGTFKGEALKDANTEWTISERVAGYDETIDATTTAGTAAITNTKDEENPTPLNPTEPKVVYYGKRFVKADLNSGERLQGAEFVVKNANNGENNGKFLALKDLNTQEGEGKALADAKAAYDNAVKAWNDAVKANPDKKDEEIEVTLPGEQEATKGKKAVEAKIAKLQSKYEDAFKKAKNAYTWVDDQNATNVVKLVSDSQGKFEIIGLEEGNYKLEETKAPQGYATKTEEEDFTVGTGTYASHAKGVTYKLNKTVNGDTGAEAQRINNKKVSIPQTGGIGSLIFVVAGLAIMAFAYTAYKKSQYQEA